mgnify:FL=1
MSQNTQRTALVTGGSSGIGRGIALALAEHGYRVAFTFGRNRAGAEETAALIADKGMSPGIFLEAKLDQPGAAEAMVAAAAEKLGGQLDVLVNNAGRTILGHTLQMETRRLDYLINLNYRSYIVAAQEAARLMAAQGTGGNILFITSSRGESAHPCDGAYCGLKAAVSRTAESMALDLASYGIRVNCIAPGATRTRVSSDRRNESTEEFASRIPLRRLGTPEDIGEAAVWLCSDAASYITGQTLVIDGGLSLPGMPERRRSSRSGARDWANTESGARPAGDRE